MHQYFECIEHACYLNNDIVEQYNAKYKNRLYWNITEISAKCNDQVLIM